MSLDHSKTSINTQNSSMDFSFKDTIFFVMSWEAHSSPPRTAQVFQVCLERLPQERKKGIFLLLLIMAVYLMQKPKGSLLSFYYQICALVCYCKTHTERFKQRKHSLVSASVISLSHYKAPVK